MNPDFKKPSSIPSLKRLARAIKVSSGVAHCDALDLASSRAGFSSFFEASKTLRAKNSNGRHRITITEYWYDRDLRESGRCRIVVYLSRPLSEILKSSHFFGRFGGFRQTQDNCLDGNVDMQSESVAKWSCAKTARSLQFVDATGLLPSKRKRRLWPEDNWDNQIPGADHWVVWYHPSLKKHLVTDEPYHGRACRRDLDREAWCSKHGYELVPVKWKGMHNPGTEVGGGTVLYLLAKKSDELPLKGIASLLDQLPAPVRDEEAETFYRHRWT